MDYFGIWEMSDYCKLCKQSAFDLIGWFFFYENKMRILKNAKQNKNTIADWMVWNFADIEYEERIIFWNTTEKKKFFQNSLGYCNFSNRKL